MRERKSREARRLESFETERLASRAAGQLGSWKAGRLGGQAVKSPFPPASKLRVPTSAFPPPALTPSPPHALRLFLPRFRSSALRLFGLFLALIFSVLPHADAKTDISSLMKENDACMLLSPDGRELVSVHGDTPLVPASMLKIFTALVGFHYLGADYRFPTEIYDNDDGDLTIKGFGDPRLISEVLQQLAVDIKAHLPEGRSTVRDIILDDTYFTSPLTIPGVSDSSEPYDAPNGALCANFNTISFKKMRDGSYVSGEEQTPLLPAVLDRVRESGLDEGRIPLSHYRAETTGYTGHLLAWFLEEAGVSMTGTVRFAVVDTVRDRLLLTFQSPYSLSEDVSALLEYSNNFMANQILIAAGARAYGAPGNLENGVRAAMDYASRLHLEGLSVTEGSGISRNNRITARTMLTVLSAFAPYRSLLRHEEHVYYKTGTLKGIATRAGYLMDSKGKAYPFVIMLNTSGKSMKMVMDGLKRIVP